MAESAKLNLRTIQRIENNETTPRRKTLKLIYEALNIEVIVLEKEKKFMNKQLIFSSFSTLIIFISSFLPWFQKKYELPMTFEGKRMISLETSTGWETNIKIFDFGFQNWLLSLSSITIGLIALTYVGLIKNKMIYILFQLVCIAVYLIAMIDEKIYLIKPAFFIIIAMTTFLIIIYKKKTVANND